MINCQFVIILFLFQARVYEGSVHLEELSILLSRRYLSAHKVNFTLAKALVSNYVNRISISHLALMDLKSCREYWEERIKTERVERVRQAKEHWESQCRAFMGV